MICNLTSHADTPSPAVVSSPSPYSGIPLWILGSGWRWGTGPLSEVWSQIAYSWDEYLLVCCPSSGMPLLSWLPCPSCSDGEKNTKWAGEKQERQDTVSWRWRDTLKRLKEVRDQGKDGEIKKMLEMLNTVFCIHSNFLILLSLRSREERYLKVLFLGAE